MKTFVNVDTHKLALVHDEAVSVAHQQMLTKTGNANPMDVSLYNSGVPAGDLHSVLSHITIKMGDSGEGTTPVMILDLCNVPSLSAVSSVLSELLKSEFDDTRSWELMTATVTQTAVSTNVRRDLLTIYRTGFSIKRR